MKEYKVYVYNINTGEVIDAFIAEFSSVNDLKEFMDSDIHNYSESYIYLHYYFYIIQRSNINEQTKIN